MKVHPFTILVPDHRSVSSDYVTLPYFYPYLHRHEEWQITWVERGRGTLLVGTDMHDFQEGDVFLIGPNLPHLLKSNPEYFDGHEDLSIKACSLYFNHNGLLAPLFQLPEMHRLLGFLNRHQQGFKVPKQVVAQIAQQIYSVHQSIGPQSIVNFVNLLETLSTMNAALEPLSSGIHRPKISESEGQRLSNIISHIMKNYHLQIGLDQIANTACMTPQAFCRYFKQHTGQTFVHYLNEIRIHEACKLLLIDNSAEVISSVAYRSGFNSITNFNRVFKSVMGQSPRDYIYSYRKISRSE